MMIKILFNALTIILWHASWRIGILAATLGENYDEFDKTKI